jgi:hypothetical protein
MKNTQRPSAAQTKAYKDFLETYHLDGYGTPCKAMTADMKAMFPDLPEDVVNHPYWRVDPSYEADAIRKFAKGTISIHHAWHPIVLVVPIDAFTAIMRDATTVVYDHDAWCRIEQAAEEAYDQRSERAWKTVADTGDIVPHLIIRTGAGDGHAQYMVSTVSSKNVTLEHLGFGDAYRDPWIDMRRGVISRRDFRAMFCGHLRRRA